MTSTGQGQEVDVLEIEPELQERFDEILQSRKDPLTEKQIGGLTRAFTFACRAHHAQTRLSGDPYITHPLEVMGILAELNVDTVTLTGALLHDVIEDTGISLEEVAREFGPVVALLVEGMTKLSSLRYDTRSNEERQAEYFRKMLLSMAHDLRVILIKLADRLHNMRTIDVMPARSQKRIAQETLDIYAPLAHRFGIGRIRWELEDHALKVLDPVAYRRIAERVAMKLEEREKALEAVVEPSKERLKADGIQAEVYGRAKHFYSIYNKIRRRGKSFEEILDLLAVRITVDTIPQCYQTLGIVHSMFTPIIERFSDYIAMPKGNGYQSLHTKVITPQGYTVEVQIRTHEMNLVAEVGIAAHWHYKEAKPGQETRAAQRHDNLSNYYKWIRQLIEGSKEESDSEEFMNNLKINLFTDEIYVFTPRGKLIQLPKESGPIDFAFAVHTDIGLHALGAKVNGRMVSLTEKLNNGDTVEVLTSSTATPNVEWLSFIRTTRARTQIKRFIKQTQFEESVRTGQDLFERSLSEQHLTIKREDLAELYSSLSFDNTEALFAAIGTGEISTARIISKLGGKVQKAEEKPKIRKKDKSNGSDGVITNVRVKGGEHYLYTFANCCNPLPGDKIVGHTTKNRGVMVHRAECPRIADLSANQDGLLEVDWDVEEGSFFHTRLRVFAEDRPNLLRDITTILSKQHLNIIEAHLRVEGALVIGTMILEVRSQSHVQKVVTRLSKIKNVVQVERVHVADVA